MEDARKSRHFGHNALLKEWCYGLFSGDRVMNFRNNFAVHLEVEYAMPLL